MGGAGAMSPLRFQVFICVYGLEGMKRVQKTLHPAADGVEYVIMRQLAPGESGDERFPALEAGQDYRIIVTPTLGIAANRNEALRHATAPAILITDDDIQLHEGALKTIMDEFDRHPEADIISFKFDSDYHNKSYPDYSFDLRRMPRFFYVSAMEIALRPARVRHRLAFNEAFGINTHFKGGEEDIFVIDALKRGLTWLFIPATVMYHPGLTTGTRLDQDYELIVTKGAVFYHKYPLSWPLRMIWRAWQDSGAGKKYPRRMTYIKKWLSGIRKARRLQVFPTPPLDS